MSNENDQPRILDEARYTYRNETCPDKLEALEVLVGELLEDIDPSIKNRDLVLHNPGVTTLLKEMKQSLYVRKIIASKEKLERSLAENNTQVKNGKVRI